MKYNALNGYVQGWWLAGLLLLSSCSILIKSPEKQVSLEARYQQMNASVPENDPNKTRIKVEVKSDLLPDATPLKKNVLNFSDGGQKALIHALDRRAGSADEFKSMIGTTYFKDDDNSNIIDHTSQTLSLTISVQNKDFFAGLSGDTSFADRLEKIRFKIALDQKDVFKFDTWNKINTQFGRFYIGTRTYTGSRTATVNPSIPIGAANLSLGSFSGTNEYAESDTLSQQVMSSNGILHDDYFTLEQDGTPKTALLGNTIIQITIKAKKTASKLAIVLDNLTDNDGKTNPPDKVKVNIKTILYPVYPSTIKDSNRKVTAKLSFDYVLRHINHGFRTFAESDDDITYYYGTITDQPVKILNADDLGLKLFYVTVDGEFIKLRDVTIADAAENLTTTGFLSNDEALAFMNWLMAPPGGGGQIKIAGKYQVGVLDAAGIFRPLSKNYLRSHMLLIRVL
ncbi:MAG: hypothetical protein ACHQHN_19055 [Sphingobacteriales bacterium]